VRYFPNTTRYEHKMSRSFLARDSMLSVLVLHGNARPSVFRLSLTPVDQSKTVEVRIVQFSPYSSLIPVVFAG